MLVDVLGQVIGVVLALTVLGCAVLVGRDRFDLSRRELVERFDAVVPYAVLLGIVLVTNKVARDVGPAVSQLFGIRITKYLWAVDGMLLWPIFPENTPQVVTWLQSMATTELTAYFTFAYVYGYVFLLVFPLLAYFVHPKPEPLRRAIVAYGANYLIGVTCYVAFVAFGPRNYIPSTAAGLMYDHHAQYQFVTTAINDQVNVFPSLHASMAVTAVLLAWSTRETYPRWVPVSAALGLSVVVATMYLGIHWATDVVFGIALAWTSVGLGRRMESTPPAFDGLGPRIRSWVAAIPTSSR